MKRGSALVMAIWAIMILSLLVVNFAGEAFVQSKVNVYMMQRVHMDQLIDSGKVVAEVVAIGCSSVSDAQENEDLEELLEKDKWIQEKRQLKSGGTVVIGPFSPDEEHPENGTVKVELQSIGGGEAGNPKININELFNGGKIQYWQEWWEMILQWAGVPEDDWPYFFHSWNDWRDTDETASHSDYGAESSWYEDDLEKEDGFEDLEDEQKYKPRNGPIPDLKELAKVRGFLNHPALITGGGKYDEKDDKDETEVKDLLQVFDVKGGEKINVNLASREVLMTIPGLRDDDDAEDTLIVDEILSERETESPSGIDEVGYGKFKDWSDLRQRIPEVEDIAEKYLSFKGGAGEEGSQYKMIVTSEAMNIVRSVEAIVIIQNKKLKYISWSENP